MPEAYRSSSSEKRNKKVAIYVRVSTIHQIDKDSLPFQRQELINYAKYVLGTDVYEIFEDPGYSAKNTDRPKYQEMMSRIRNKEFSHLIVWKIDRISRNLKDFIDMYEEIKEYDTTFISKNEQFDTSAAMGEAMLKIILVFAELERKITGERVFSIMLSRAEKGLWNGGRVPYGYILPEEIEFPIINEQESHIVQFIYDYYKKVASTSKVAYKLNSDHVKTKESGKWTAKTINDILRNPFYIGTYRYNIKNDDRRLKDKSEWVVVENNHSPIISVEQYNIVNDMLTANYRGNGEFQRANTNTHIFSKLLYCGKCGSTFNAGLDSARKDGYRPSRYTCYSNHHAVNSENCNNFVSDITILPFMLNYISNFINLQSKITRNHSLRDIERILLRGRAFVDVLGIDKKGLEETYIAFAVGFQSRSYETPGEEDCTNLELENLKKEKQKYEKALTRLEDLYLYSDEAISEKDFLFKKRDIVQNIDRVNGSLAALHKSLSDMKLTTDTSFLNKASNFLMTKELTNKRDIDFREFLEVVDKGLIQDFIQSVIDKIVIVDKKILSITFKNDITHQFIYKPVEQRKIRTKEKFLYISFESDLLEYLKEHGSATRVDVEKITGMSRTGALSLLTEFMERGIVEKRGNSIAIQYFLVKKKST